MPASSIMPSLSMFKRMEFLLARALFNLAIIYCVPLCTASPGIEAGPHRGLQEEGPCNHSVVSGKQLMLWNIWDRGWDRDSLRIRKEVRNYFIYSGPDH